MRRPLTLSLALAALALTGCAAPAAELPPTITASVFQNRFDYSLRQLEIKVANGTGATITVTRAEFESTRFTEAAVWDRPQEIPAGAARDLKVQLPDPVCDGAAPVDSVTLEVTLGDGTSGSVTVTPSDEQGRVDTINAEDCLGASVAAVASISPPAALDWVPGAHAPAVLELAVQATGGAGTVTVHDAKGTVLLGLADEQGAAITIQPVGLVVDADTAASAIRLRVIPNRCDPHAVEEDKRGTFFPLDVETGDGRSGTVYIAVSDGVRRSLYEFYADYCGLPG
ncbi:hypothetical protein BH11ACT5_BH11ACT5_28080 [soil metagenome]